MRKLSKIDKTVFDIIGIDSSIVCGRGIQELVDDTPFQSNKQVNFTLVERRDTIMIFPMMLDLH